MNLTDLRDVLRGAEPNQAERAIYYRKLCDGTYRTPEWEADENSRARQGKPALLPQQPDRGISAGADTVVGKPKRCGKPGNAQGGTK